MTPLNNPIGAAALIAGRGDVDAVMVAGAFVKREGRLVRDDLRRLRDQALQSRDFVFRAAGVEYPGEWMPPTYQPADPSAAVS
jgi:hypothetical protein